MDEKKELSKVILDTCDKELDGSIGFMLTEREADTFATAILSAGYVRKSEIEKLIPGKMLDYATPDPNYCEGFVDGHSACRDEILENLKDIIK